MTHTTTVTYATDHSSEVSYLVDRNTGQPYRAGSRLIHLGMTKSEAWQALDAMGTAFEMVENAQESAR